VQKSNVGEKKNGGRTKNKLGREGGNTSQGYVEKNVCANRKEKKS